MKNIIINGKRYLMVPALRRWSQNYVETGLYIISSEDMDSFRMYGYKNKHGEMIIQPIPEFETYDDMIDYEKSLISMYVDLGSWEEVFQCLSL